jgi:tRNA pseudouridine38-40 synthase
VRYFLELSFLGTNYHGWQRQQNAHTIQQELENALKILLRKDTETTGCGRTDTGVHARKFFAHFDSDSVLEENFLYHLNSLLPRDISIINIHPVKNDAHARFDATSRTYEYIVVKRKDALLFGLSYQFEYPIDIDRMNRFAKTFLGHHDFASFSKSRTQVKTTVCNVTEAAWKEEEHQLTFKITADRFLRNMVRAIVGTLLEAGEGKLSEDGFKAIFKSKNRSEAGMSVPACGLYLCDVKYPYIISN